MVVLTPWMTNPEGFQQPAGYTCDDINPSTFRYQHSKLSVLLKCFSASVLTAVLTIDCHVKIQHGDCLTPSDGADAQPLVKPGKLNWVTKVYTSF